jgi:hypothetical protein
MCASTRVIYQQSWFVSGDRQTDLSMGRVIEEARMQRVVPH